jgi:hypothetical protein
LYRCLGRVEAAVGDSWIFVAVLYRCLGRVEAAVGDSWGLRGCASIGAWLIVGGSVRPAEWIGSVDG